MKDSAARARSCRPEPGASGLMSSRLPGSRPSTWRPPRGPAGRWRACRRACQGATRDYELPRRRSSEARSVPRSSRSRRGGGRRNLAGRGGWFAGTLPSLGYTTGQDVPGRGPARFPRSDRGVLPRDLRARAHVAGARRGATQLLPADDWLSADVERLEAARRRDAGTKRPPRLQARRLHQASAPATASLASRTFPRAQRAFAPHERSGRLPPQTQRALPPQNAAGRLPPRARLARGRRSTTLPAPAPASPSAQRPGNSVSVRPASPRVAASASDSAVKRGPSSATTWAASNSSAATGIDACPSEARGGHAERRGPWADGQRKRAARARGDRTPNEVPIEVPEIPNNVPSEVPKQKQPLGRLPNAARASSGRWPRRCRRTASGTRW